MVIVGTDGNLSPTYRNLVPTARTHFANSKCFNSPAPNALPKPPFHWTSGKVEKAGLRRSRKVTGGTDSSQISDEDVDCVDDGDESSDSCKKEDEGAEQGYETENGIPETRPNDDLPVSVDQAKEVLAKKCDETEEKDEDEGVGVESTSVEGDEEVSSSSRGTQSPCEGEGAAAAAGLMTTFKRNLLDDFETHNLKLLLKVQS